MTSRSHIVERSGPGPGSSLSPGSQRPRAPCRAVSSRLLLFHHPLPPCALSDHRLFGVFETFYICLDFYIIVILALLLLSQRRASAGASQLPSAQYSLSPLFRYLSQQAVGGWWWCVCVKHFRRLLAAVCSRPSVHPPSSSPPAPPSPFQA